MNQMRSIRRKVAQRLKTRKGQRVQESKDAAQLQRPKRDFNFVIHRLLRSKSASTPDPRFFYSYIGHQKQPVLRLRMTFSQRRRSHQGLLRNSPIRSTLGAEEVWMAWLWLRAKITPRKILGRKTSATFYRRTI